MFIPKHFEISDTETIDEFVHKNSFGQLISLQDGEIVSSHIPFLYLPDEEKLLAHVARANPQWQQIDQQNVLVTLQGEHAYISPGWYHSAGVPTWNYQSVHIKGNAKTFDDPERLKSLVDTLSEKNEAAYAEPWQPDYASSMLRAIVGIEIAISTVQCKFKISQNRSVEDQASVADQLISEGFTSIAHAMKKNLDEKE